MDYQESFITLKRVLIKALMFAHLTPHCFLSWNTDVSNVGMGRVLAQVDPEVQRVQRVTYFNKTFTKHEHCYSHPARVPRFSGNHQTLQVLPVWLALHCKELSLHSPVAHVF